MPLWPQALRNVTVLPLVIYTDQLSQYIFLITTDKNSPKMWGGGLEGVAGSKDSRKLTYRPDLTIVIIKLHCKPRNEVKVRWRHYKYI